MSDQHQKVKYQTNIDALSYTERSLADSKRLCLLMDDNIWNKGPMTEVSGILVQHDTICRSISKFKVRGQKVKVTERKQKFSNRWDGRPLLEKHSWIGNVE